MPQYRKKPIVIDAYHFLSDEASPEWLVDAFAKQKARYVIVGRVHAILIETLEGTMSATIGDWIIKGVKGELYPCKPDIFAATYEPVQ